MSLNGPTITWLGHATLLITTANGKRILVDPWLSTNPSCPAEFHQVDSDAILITHGHADHIGSLFDSAPRCTGPIVCIADMAGWLGQKGINGEQLVGMNKGGSVYFKDLGIRVTMTDARHSSSFVDENGTIIYLGEAAGFVVKFDLGPTVYIAGDTCLFGDMKLIGELWEPEIAVLPIGDFYTMDPLQAAHATRMLGATTIIPYHYETFPGLTGRPETLRAELDALGVEATVLSGKPGTSWS